MTAAIAEVPKDKKTLHTMPAATLPAIKPAQYPTQDVPVHLIVRSETNRVPEVDDDFIESIRGGVNSPVLLRPIKATQEHTEAWMRIDVPPIKVGDTIYKLVYGERRWIAAKKCGHTHIPAVIRELTDTRALEIQVEENEQRKDYNIMDRAAAYAHLRAQYMKDHHGEKGFTEEKCMDLIAQTCKNDKIKGRTVQQIIALLKLSRECQEALRKGEMEQTHAYELCRRTPEEQLVLLQWLRRETLHGQGDIPSTRRLIREIREMDRIAEEKRRQDSLFKEEAKAGSGAGAKLTFDGKTIDLVPGPLSVSVRTALYKFYPGLSITTAYFLKDGRLQLSIGSNGKPFYLRVEQVQKLLSGKISIEALSAETSAPIRPTQALASDPRAREPGSNGSDFVKNKPPTEAQIKRAQKEREEEQERFEKQQAEHRRTARVDEQYRASLFVALASKAHVCSRLLTHVVPHLLIEVWDMDDAPIEKLARDVLAWPAPKGDKYTYNEIEAHAKKHTRKFSANVLAALVITLQMNQPEAERLAKYFKIDPKKLRQKAAAAVKQEDAQAKLKAKGQGPKAGVRA